VLNRVGAPRENSNAAVFPSRNGTWQQVNTVERRWRQIRKDTGLEWVTPHIFRKTVATLISERVDAETASQQLGLPPPPSPGSPTSPNRPPRLTPPTSSKNWLVLGVTESPPAPEHLRNKCGTAPSGSKEETGSDPAFLQVRAGSIGRADRI
jgi:hypothetical protein